MTTESPTFPARLANRIRRSMGPLEIVVIVLGALAFLALGWLNTFDLFFEFTRDHEDWQLDEIANLFLVTTIGLTVLLAARTRRLRREIAQRIAAEAEAAALARHDPLTGIANRRLFNEELERMLSAERRSDGNFAVLLFDLNRFKAVNDSHGHPAGDQLLILIAQRLKQLARRQDVLARLGGDEFALAVADTDKDAALRLVTRLIAAVEEPVSVGDKKLSVGASVGIALFPADATDPDELVRRADMAMYRAKSTDAGYAFFDPTIDQALRDREILEAELREAAGGDAIVPHYQPLINLSNGRPFGFAVQAYWQHPTRGMLPPESFIPIAEDMRLIGRLAMGLLRRAVRDAAAWSLDLVLAVDIAPDQLRDPGLADEILGVLADAGFPANRLEIKITEDALAGDLALARDTIDTMRAAGIRIAIDDFGQGYSSLFYLRELPIDVIKIDQTFVSTRRFNAESARIVAAVIGLGDAMGLTTVAEGLEDAMDADWMRAEAGGAADSQTHPVPASEIAALLEKPRRKPAASAA